MNELLKVYLGTDSNGGFQPIGCEQRMRAAFPSEYVQKMKEIEPYLTEDHTADWSKHDLVQEAAVFADALRRKYPELEDVVVRSLANRFAYGHR